MTSHCVSCGTELEPGAKFCSACGAKVVLLPPPVADVASRPPETTVPASDRTGRRAGMVIKRIGPLSAAKMQGALMALFGLIFGLFFAAIGSMASIASQQTANPLAFMGAAFGVGAAIILPIGYGIFGFISGLIWAGLYNLLAGFVGGIEIETS